jgi:CheY-like chemotaxis protein
MRLVIIDEDEIAIPHVVDELRQGGHDVVQVSKWADAPDVIRSFKPDGIALDLMIPPIDLPVEECNGGFSTGRYLYERILHPVASGIPFVIYSAAFPRSEMVKDVCEALRSFAEFRGFVSKASDVDELARAFTRTH